MSSSGEYGVQARIFGRVQGVWYRAWTEKEASRRGLRGWVRNRTGGSVEAVFAGERTQVEAMLEACRIGPPAARVTDIDIQAIEEYDEGGFQVLPTI
ncbi:MAG: acylphosphatase [Pseudomonadota bacterium]|nr:acylphosphatase [Pseudomonadota bacterium]